MKLRIIVIKNNNNIFKKSANIIFTSKNILINKLIKILRLTYTLDIYLQVFRVITTSFDRIANHKRRLQSVIFTWKLKIRGGEANVRSKSGGN